MMLDAYAACEGDSSAVVAIQNKYLEEARLEKQSRSRGKHVQEVWIGDYMPTSPLHSSSHPDLLLLLLLLLLLFYFTFWKNLLHHGFFWPLVAEQLLKLVLNIFNLFCYKSVRAFT